MKNLLKRHHDISKLWNEVQGYLKEAEQNDGYSYIPAINEMRYAARKLLDVWIVLHEADKRKKLSSAVQSELEEKLVIAEQYLINAHHDITDEIIGNLKVSLNIWEERYGLGVFQSVTSKRKKFEEMLLAAQSLVVESREEREVRKSLYARLRAEHVPALVAEYKDLETSLTDNVANILAREEALEALTETISNTNDELRSMRLWKRVGIILSILGILIALTRFLPI